MKHAALLTPADFSHVHKVHAIGIGGTVISGIAELLLGWGRKVSGSETTANGKTEALSHRGASVTISRKAVSLPPAADLVLVSPRAPRNHPDLIAAKQWGIPVVSAADMLGIISRLHDTIAVAGAHGKTTVAAYLGTLLAQTGADPSVLVRSDVDVWAGNVRRGKGRYFITEADENQRRFLSLSPTIALIMNIEADHLDYFKDLKAVIKAFHEFTHALPKEAVCIVNGDDPHIIEIVKRIRARVIRFGRGDGMDVRAIGIEQGEKGVSFTVHVKKGEGDLQILLNLAGEHQIMNALAVIAAAQALGIPLEQAKEVLESYPGGKRHMEVLGERDGVMVIDDAADHPAEIKTVLKGIRSRYPERKIWCIFQPYLENRTNYLLNEFAQSFTDADRVFIMPIIKGVEEGGGETPSHALVEAAQKYHPFVSPVSPLKRGEGEGGVEVGVASEIFTQLPAHSLLVTLGADPVRKIGEGYLAR